MKTASPKIPEFWISVLIYFVATELLILATRPSLAIRPDILVTRLCFGLVFALLFFLKKVISGKKFVLLSTVAVYAMLTLLYKETGTLNTLLFQKFDPYLMEADQALFGFQPSVAFSQTFHSAVFSELMYFGYFFYYLMPLIIMLLLYRYAPQKIPFFGFTLITCFLVYYFVFILMPAEGPQFYFPYPENTLQAHGFFGWAVKLIQHNGEASTAAFPSSHVGISLIVLMWLWFNERSWVNYFLPLSFILMFSTVYIKAHYFVDVAAGIVSAPIVFYISSRFFNFIRNHYEYQHQGSTES